MRNHALAMVVHLRTHTSYANHLARPLYTEDGPHGATRVSPDESALKKHNGLERAAHANTVHERHRDSLPFCPCLILPSLDIAGSDTCTAVQSNSPRQSRTLSLLQGQRVHGHGVTSYAYTKRALCSSNAKNGASSGLIADSARLKTGIHHFLGLYN